MHAKKQQIYLADVYIGAEDVQWLRGPDQTFLMVLVGGAEGVKVVRV